MRHACKVVGWPKCSFGFSHNILWRQNPHQLFAELDTWYNIWYKENTEYQLLGRGSVIIFSETAPKQ